MGLISACFGCCFFFLTDKTLYYCSWAPQIQGHQTTDYGGPFQLWSRVRLDSSRLHPEELPRGSGEGLLLPPALPRSDSPASAPKV